MNVLTVLDLSDLIAAADPPPGFHPFDHQRYFYNSVGPMFVRYMGGRVNFGFRVMEKHVNAAGIGHGGMLFTVMDIQLGLGANVDTGVKGFTITVSMTADFVGPVRLGQWVQAENTIVRQTRSLIFNEGRLTADGEILLRANAVLKIGRETEDYDVNDHLPPAFFG